MSEDDTRGRSALVVVDMVNPYRFPDADAVAANAPVPARRIAKLLERARAEDVPVIYVNDNYGDWNSSSEELLRHALEGEHPELVEPLAPEPGDAFVIKARHSIFYGTPLEYLLATQDIGRIVMVGQVTEQCILYSALDAYVRHFRVAVVRDAVIQIDDELAEASLRMMERNMRADVESAADADLR